MKKLTAQEVRDLRTRVDDLRLVNVLGEEKFKKQHIPGSSNVPVDRDDFIQQVERVAGGKDKPVVVYCSDKSCDASPTAAKKLDQAGFREVYDFEGGMQEWQQNGMSLEGTA